MPTCTSINMFNMLIYNLYIQIGTVISTKKNNEGCEVRTRADNCPADLKSAALDHSANPPDYLKF